MWVLVRVEESLLRRLTDYFKEHGIWFKFFSEKVYDIRVTAEDRIKAFQSRRTSYYVNPSAAWRTCKQLREIWDWDNLGRGPWADSYGRSKNQAPRGKGWITNASGHRQRVAGDCKNPNMLNYISCPMWCPDYEPTTIEGMIYLMETTAAEHDRRAATLRSQIEFLKHSEQTFEEAIKGGKIADYRDGEFVSK